MKKYWTTQFGEEIEYKKLEDNHLINILKWVEKRATDGVVIQTGGGSSPEDFWYEEEEIGGEDVFYMFDYKGLKKELKRRKLIHLT